MTKRDIGLLIAERLGFKKKDGIYIVDKILRGIIEILKNKKRLEIRGLGSFAVVSRKPKKGRLFLTKKPVDIPPFKTVVFIPGKAIRRL